MSGRHWLGSTSAELSHRLYLGNLNMTWEQWAAALHLATMWSFDQVRCYVITQMDIQIKAGSVHPLDRVDVATKCRVPEWVVPAYTELCERQNSLTVDEASHMSLPRLMAVCRIREIYRSEGASGWCARCRKINIAKCGICSTVCAADIDVEALVKKEPLFEIN